MSTKFEQLLDLLVNEEMDAANALFHDIVVEKSREIYETMIAEETEEEDEDVEESTDEEDDEESVEEGFGNNEEESMYEIGGDSADDLMGDTEDPLASGDSEDDSEDDEFGAPEGDFGGDAEGGSEPATKDDVLDLAQAMDEIKATFAALLAGEKHEEEGNPDVHGGALDDIESDSEEETEDEPEEVPADTEADEQFMREYKEVVGKPYGGGKVAGKTEDASTHKVSPVSSAKGRPTTSATAGNIAQAGKGDQNEKGKAGGLVGNVKGEFTGNHLNKVGGYKGDAFTKNSSGHGPEKKGTGEGPVNDKILVKPYKQ